MWACVHACIQMSTFTWRTEVKLRCCSSGTNNLTLFYCFVLRQDFAEQFGCQWNPETGLPASPALGFRMPMAACMWALRNYTQLFLLARWTSAAESPLQPASAVGLNPLNSRSRELHTQTTDLRKVDLLKVDIISQLAGYTMASGMQE